MSGSGRNTTRTTFCATRQKRSVASKTEIRGFVARRGGERERDARTWWIKTENGTGSKLIPAWVSPRPPTPGEIYLPFRSSVHFLYSPATQLAYPRSRTATRHALIKFNNFCATRALRVLFALHPSLPPSLSIFRTGLLLLPRSFSRYIRSDSPRSLSRYKLVWRLARAPPPSCYYYRVPQIYDGDMLDPVKQARSARDFISERGGGGKGKVCFAGVHRRLLRMPPLPSFSSSSHIPFR